MEALQLLSLYTEFLIGNLMFCAGCNYQLHTAFLLWLIPYYLLKLLFMYLYLFQHNHIKKENKMCHFHFNLHNYIAAA